MSPEIDPALLRSISTGVFLLVMAFFGITSVILHYHWVRYEIDKAHMRRMQRVYLGISSACITILVVLLIGFFL